MTIERKVGMGIAGQPSGSTDVAEVFSTDLYTGDDGNVDITNGIDLAGEGGMVWLKSRSGYPHTLWSSETTGNLVPNSTDPINNVPLQPTFNSDGFTFPNNATYNGWVTTNSSSHTYVSWTFRKKEKFFDIVSYSGDGTSNRQISHSLGSTPAMVIIKATNQYDGWYVYHTSLGFGQYLSLNGTQYANQYGAYPPVSAASDTTFTTVLNTGVNSSSSTYVAYLFADNSAEDAEDQMIKCGSYVGNGNTDGPFVNLGWEPQFVLIKNTQRADNWLMVDTMRGMPNATSPLTSRVFANASTAEGATYPICYPDSLGFKVHGGGTAHNWGGETFIYMAIRAPMMKKPEAATDVFAVDNANGSDVPAFNSGFPVDMTFWSGTDGGNTKIASRLTGGKYLETEGAGAEQADTSYAFDYPSGWYKFALAVTNYAYMWKRAKGFFDVVAYSGTSSATTVAHSLGVAPEMMWLKQRGQAENWQVYNSESGNTKAMRLNMSVAVPEINQTRWNSTNPTDTVFSTTESGGDYIVYLFATLAGISKVGSYTGNGSSQTISCGFSAGARFILIKRTDASGELVLCGTH